ncbi:MAG: hypothetical protein HKN29_07850 [Rhodothermales bacterium]|nr:hypothetical protein [Rhodothermales bacterium]
MFKILSFAGKVATRTHLMAVAVGVFYLTLALGCRMPGPGQDSAPARAVAQDVPEVLNPDSLWRMPAELKEISALAIAANGDLLTLHDEDGDIYRVNSSNGVVQGRTRLAGSGDFEALAAWDSVVVALRSDGRLYRSGPGEDTKRYDLDLHGSCDLESADVRPGSGQLWIGCKEDPGRRLGRTRAFYSVALDDLLGDERDLEPMLELRLETPPDPRTEKGQPYGRFKPSALAFLDADRFLVLSSVYPALFEYRVDGTLLDSWSLPRTDLTQPEGIAVDARGTLYIASEGTPGVIAVFQIPSR